MTRHWFVFLCVLGVSEVLGVAEVIGVAETSTALGIEAMNPSNREEFDELQAAISKKVQSYAKSPHFPAFAEELIRNICVNCKCSNRNFGGYRAAFWWQKCRSA